MTTGPISLESQFGHFAKVGDPRADGKKITLTNADKWMQQAKILDGKQLTLTDTGICFNKMKSKYITYGQFVKYLEDLANSKNMDFSVIKNKLITCGQPGSTNTPQGAK